MMTSTMVRACGVVALLLSACAVAPAGEPEAAGSQQQALQKSDPRKIYVHLMPWFETPGYHWDMVGRHYNPQIGPYHSGDYNVIEYQLLLMKYSGIDGVIIDWPGRSTMNPDLPANAENTDQIIDQTAKFGLEFAVCFEDQYAVDTGDAVNSMHWVRDHYFNRPNQIKIDGRPALFVFGPQKIGAGDWPSVLDATGSDPMFFTLWYNTGAGGARDGTFAWIYSDGLTGVRNYYGRADQGSKVAVLYPGFDAAYANGPGWSIPYDVEGDTFTALWNASKGVGQVVQIATWNDYTEGTMIEPTNEFGYRYLTKLQQLLGVSYGQDELEMVRKLYDLRKAGDPKADAVSNALNAFDLAGACAQLGCTAPSQGGTGSGSNGASGSANAAGNGPASGGTSSTSSGGHAGTSSAAGAQATSAGASAAAGSNASAGTGGSASVDDADEGGGCSLTSTRSGNWGYLLAALGLIALRRRARRAA